MPATGPGWVDHVIWWHVYPLGFTGADTTGGDRHRGRTLGHVADWLDHAVELGASGLALGPIFASSTHGYDTVDHLRIDARLGTEDDFDRLVDEARRRGLRIILDGVFNHVGRDHPTFRRVLEQGPAAPGADWFRLTWPEGAGPGTEPGYADFEGHHGLVALDHDNPAVVDLVIDVMGSWLARGVDGWRLDAAYAVPARFWAEVTARVRTVHPDAYLVGEVIHGDYAAFVAASGLDSVTQYELWKAVWSALNDRNLFELTHALGRHDGYLDTFVPLTFLGNHDVTRLASRLVDERHLPHALVVLFTVGGTPSVYYGDEEGWSGVKEDRVGGDDAVRPAFPASPADLPADGEPVRRLHQELIGLRRRHSWLHTARTEIIELRNETLVYASVSDGRRIVVVLNLSDDEVSAAVDPRGPGRTAELLAGGPHTRIDGGTVVVAPHGWAVVGPPGR